MGYAWCVPKGNGFVNIGIGGKSNYFKRSNTNIHDHFRDFLGDLVKQGRLDSATADALKSTGHPYFLFTHDGPVKAENCFLIGDSAGLASQDLGEGIGPAVESGLMAAGEILGTAEYRKDAITQFSFGGVTRKILEYLTHRKSARKAPAPAR
jgi:flavin-dependent dehydrogenase